MDWIGEESNESKEEDIESNESDLQDAAYQADLDKLEAYETDLGRMVETNEIGSVDSNESVELGNHILLYYQESFERNKVCDKKNLLL